MFLHIEPQETVLQCNPNLIRIKLELLELTRIIFQALKIVNFPFSEEIVPRL